MAKDGDKRGGKPGIRGNKAHERNEAAAAIIERLAGYGMPQKCISDFLDWIGGDILDLGSQGYSLATLKVHYRDELDKGKAPGLELLMSRMYSTAMMDSLPEGVSPDRAYSVAYKALMDLLNVQHGIIPHQSMRHAGPGGGPIPLALIEATLTPEEIAQLARITRKLELAAAEQ